MCYGHKSQLLLLFFTTPSGESSSDSLDAGVAGGMAGIAVLVIIVLVLVIVLLFVLKRERRQKFVIAGNDLCVVWCTDRMLKHPFKWYLDTT